MIAGVLTTRAPAVRPQAQQWPCVASSPVALVTVWEHGRRLQFCTYSIFFPRLKTLCCCHVAAEIKQKQSGSFVTSPKQCSAAKKSFVCFSGWKYLSCTPFACGTNEWGFSSPLSGDPPSPEELLWWSFASRASAVFVVGWDRPQATPCAHS